MVWTEERLRYNVIVLGSAVLRENSKSRLLYIFLFVCLISLLVGQKGPGRGSEKSGGQRSLEQDAQRFMGYSTGRFCAPIYIFSCFILFLDAASAV